MLPSDEPPQTSRVVTVEAGRSDERNNAASPVLANNELDDDEPPPPPPEEELDDDEGPTKDGSPPGAGWNAAMAAHNLNVTTTSFVRPDGSAKIATTYEPLEIKDRPTDTKDQLTVATPASPPYFFQDVDPNTCQVLGPWLAVAPTPVQPCALLAAGPDGKHGVRNHYLTFTDDASGIPPAPYLQPGSPENELQAQHLAVMLVRKARQLCRKGPFNNREGLSQSILGRDLHPRTTDGRGDFIFYDALDELDPEQRLMNGEPLGDAGHFLDKAEMENLPCRTVGELASLSAATRKIEGGVCEKLSALVLGLFSRYAPPGSEACKIAWRSGAPAEHGHTSNHHYVVLRVGNSQWWVADPWPQRSVVLPWSANRFPHDETEHFTHLHVVYPVEHAFGVPLDERELNRSLRFAEHYVPETTRDSAFEHRYAIASNEGDEVGEHTVAAEPDEWGVWPPEWGPEN